MKLPDGWELFYDDVCKKIKTLTSCGVWPLDSSTILAWLANFTKNEHQYIAAHILDRVTLRTEKMLEGSFRIFLASTFKEYAQNFTSSKRINIDEWFNILGAYPKGEYENIKLCPVSITGESGDSGGHIVRILTGSLFNRHRAISVNTTPLISLNNQVILLVDDFVGSGDQFKKFAQQENLKQAAKQNHIVYVPALAYYKGIKSLFEEDYGIEIIPLETINQNEQFFLHEPGCRFCGDDLNSEIDVLNVYREMRSLRSNFGKSSWLGKDSASLCVMFQWGCPNQSLGVMWYNGGSEWNRLTRRRGSQ